MVHGLRPIRRNGRQGGVRRFARFPGGVVWRGSTDRRAKRRGGRRPSTTTPETPSFDPLVDISWFAAWFAEDPDWTNPGDGNPVSEWDDGSGNGNPVGALTTARPTFRSSYAGLNSRPAVEFDGSTDTMTTGAITLAQPYSLVVIGKSDSATAAQVALGAASASTKVLSWNSSAAGNKRVINAGTRLDGAASDTGSGLLVGVFNGASSRVEYNGAGADGNAGTNAFSAEALRMSGSGGTLTSPFDGAIAFAGVYDGNVLNDANWPDFETWAASHYGITIA